MSKRKGQPPFLPLDPDRFPISAEIERRFEQTRRATQGLRAPMPPRAKGKGGRPDKLTPDQIERGQDFVRAHPKLSKSAAANKILGLLRLKGKVHPTTIIRRIVDPMK